MRARYSLPIVLRDLVQEIRSKQERRQDMVTAKRIQESVLPKTLSLDPARATILGTRLIYRRSADGSNNPGVS